MTTGTPCTPLTVPPPTCAASAKAPTPATGSSATTTRIKHAPDYCIRVYHDARLAEARLELNLPLRELRAAKLAHNRALAEWLDYCRRHRYRLHNTALTAPLDIA